MISSMGLIICYTINLLNQGNISDKHYKICGEEDNLKQFFLLAEDRTYVTPIKTTKNSGVFQVHWLTQEKL